MTTPSFNLGISLGMFTPFAHICKKNNIGTWWPYMCFLASTPSNMKEGIIAWKHVICSRWWIVRRDFLKSLNRYRKMVNRCFVNTNLACGNIHYVGFWGFKTTTHVVVCLILHFSSHLLLLFFSTYCANQVFAHIFMCITSKQCHIIRSCHLQLKLIGETMNPNQVLGKT
jgi:hypothetical protein